MLGRHGGVGGSVKDVDIGRSVKNADKATRRRFSWCHGSSRRRHFGRGRRRVEGWRRHLERRGWRRRARHVHHLALHHLALDRYGLLWRRHTGKRGAGLFPTALANRPAFRPPRRTSIPRVTRLGHHGCFRRQNPVPLELDVRVLFFEHPDRIFVKRRAANLDVRRRAKPVKQLGLFGTRTSSRRVHQVGALVAPAVAGESQGWHALLALWGWLDRTLGDRSCQPGRFGR